MGPAIKNAFDVASDAASESVSKYPVFKAAPATVIAIGILAQLVPGFGEFGSVVEGKEPLEHFTSKTNFPFRLKLTLLLMVSSLLCCVVC